MKDKIVEKSIRTVNKQTGTVFYTISEEDLFHLYSAGEEVYVWHKVKLPHDLPSLGWSGAWRYEGRQDINCGNRDSAGKEVNWDDIEAEFWERFQGVASSHQAIFNWIKLRLKKLTRPTLSLPTEEEIGLMEWLEKKIIGCDELGGLEREKFAFIQCLRKVRTIYPTPQQPSDSAGEECLYCTNGLEDRGNGDVADCSHCGGAGKLTRPTVSEGEIIKLISRHSSYDRPYNMHYVKSDKWDDLAKAIKELLNQKR